MRISPLFITTTTTGSCDSSGGVGGSTSFGSGLFGKYSQNCLASRGVITMKMMSSTSMTSTRGVTFMLGVARPGLPPPEPTSIAMVLDSPQLLLVRALELVDAHRDTREADVLAHLEERPHVAIAGLLVGTQHQASGRF